MSDLDTAIGERKQSMDRKSDKEMSGRQKAATLLIALGLDACAQIFKILEEEEVETLAAEIAGIPYISSNSLASVLHEFRVMVSAETGAIQGGIEYATEAISKALGTEDSIDAMERIRASSKPFDLLTATPSATELLLGMIREEHPQTIALILVHVKEQRAADILSGLAPELRADVIARIANMTTVSPEVVANIEDALQMKSHGQERVRAGGVRTAAEILNRAEADVEKEIMELIGNTDPELAEEISDLMFTYEDISTITDTGIQKLLQEIPEGDLMMALKASTEEIKTKFMRNMSERRRETVQEDIDSMPPVRLKDVLSAQKRILAVIKEMTQMGKLEIIRDEEDDVFV